MSLKVPGKSPYIVCSFVCQSFVSSSVSESGEFSPLLEPSGEYRTAAILPKHLVFIAGGIGVTPAIAALKGRVGTG